MCKDGSKLKIKLCEENKTKQKLCEKRTFKEETSELVSHRWNSAGWADKKESVG